MENQIATTGSDTPTQVAPQVQQTETVNQNTNAAAIQPVVPEKYELKLGENAPLDASYLESFQSYAKDQKMTQEQAQKLVEREAYAVSEYQKRQSQDFEQTQAQWIDTVKKDPEIGGEAFQKNIELAHRALKQFGTQTFIEQLESSGFGNHPELVRIFARIGKAFGEDTLVSTNTNSGGKKSYEEVFYGPQ